MILKSFKFFILLSFLLTSSQLFAQNAETPTDNGDGGPMTQDRMAEIIGELVEEYEGSKNNLQFVYGDVFMALISDADNNRMRILAPIMESKDLTPEHMQASMVSNFHLALDARYAIGNGVLYATYIHPLKELTRSQLESALRQVSTLRTTFGSTYTSGELTYGGRNPEEQDI